MKRTKKHQPSDTDLLNFVGLHVSEITTLTGRGHRVQIAFYPTKHEIQIITAKGKTVIDAFRKAALAAWKQYHV